MELNAYIDHTVLKAEATLDQVERLINEAKSYSFAAVCINGHYVRQAATLLAGTEIALAAVSGFPLGASTPHIKAIESGTLVGLGATEIDVVAYLPDLIDCNEMAIRQELEAVVHTVKDENPTAKVKVIFETAYLMQDADEATAEKRIATACSAAGQAGCDYVKTSTGFHAAGGASIQAVQWLKKYAGGMKVKAAGGIRDKATALAMIDAGADRLGCSASVSIVSE